MYFITTKRMLEVCFFQHTPTFIIEPVLFDKMADDIFNMAIKTCECDIDLYMD